MKTKIEWADYTFNPWLGCSKVSPACKNCYAESWAKRSGLVGWGDQAKRRRTSEANWREPLKWNREAAKAGERLRVFCASLADVFEDRPELCAWRYELFCLIRDTPALTWMLLTKRPENITRLWPADWVGPDDEWWPNLWLGTTVENQEQADNRIPELLKIPAAVRFLSCEPLLGPVDLTRIPTGHWAYGHVDVMSGYLCGDEPDEMCDWDADPNGWVRKPAGEWDRGEHGIDWVIVGGESGANARPMHPDWARSLRDQTRAAGVAFHFKQWGQWAEEMFTDEHAAIPYARRFAFDDGQTMVRVGKTAAGRLLDGAEHNDFPQSVL